jgi:hypothetical protein
MDITDHQWAQRAITNLVGRLMALIARGVWL